LERIILPNWLNILIVTIATEIKEFITRQENIPCGSFPAQVLRELPREISNDEKQRKRGIRIAFVRKSDERAFLDARKEKHVLDNV